MDLIIGNGELKIENYDEPNWLTVLFSIRHSQFSILIMCLIFLALNHHPTYKLIVAANRDEFYNRQTAATAWWEDHPDIVGGRDLQAMGTWMAMSRKGRISMVTNYRDPKNINPDAPSRGRLVSDYLLSSVTPDQYLKALEPHAKSYNGFNLLVGNPDQMHYLSNYGPGASQLKSGFYGLSNHLLETPWPKVVRGKKKITPLLTHETLDPETLMEALDDDRVATDQLPVAIALAPAVATALALPASQMLKRTSGFPGICNPRNCSALRV